MMFGSKRRQTAHLVEKMERQLDLIHTALIVRDPGTSVSVDAYEGLRKQVIAGASARQAHVAQLAEFDVALRRGANAEDLAALTTQWLEQAGVARIEDPSIRDAFDGAVAPEAAAEVEIPGYVNTATGQLVRQGRLRALPKAGSPERESPTPVEKIDAPENETAASAPSADLAATDHTAEPVSATAESPRSPELKEN